MKKTTNKGHWFQLAAMLSIPGALAAGTGVALLGTGAFAAAVFLWHGCENYQNLDIQQPTEQKIASLKLKLLAGVQDHILLFRNPVFLKNQVSVANKQLISQYNYNNHNEQWKQEANLKILQTILWNAGCVISALLIAAIYLAHRTYRRYLEIEKINQQLQQALQHRVNIEIALKESEERYRRLLELSPEAILLHCGGKIIYANPAATEFFGAAHMEEIIGLEICNFIHPEELEIFHENVNQKNWQIHKLIRLDKIIINAEVISTKVSYNAKTAVITIFRDITERLRAAQSLKESEEKFREFAEAIPLPLLISRASDGVILYSNSLLAATFGVSEENLVNLKTDDFYNNPDERQILLEKISENGCIRNWEVQVKKADGTPFWANVSVQPLSFNGYRALLCAFYDITEQKHAEEELREISISLENAVDGIARLDTQGRYVAVNRGYANTIGYKPEETIGLEWQNTIHPEERQKIMSAYQFMLRVGKVEIETRGVRKDGSVFYQELVMTKVCDRNKNFIGHYCFIKDITERKLAEAALRESEQRYRSVIETAAEGIVLLSADGSVSACNYAAERILGISAGQMMLRASLGTPLRAIHEDGSPFPSEIHPASVTLRTGKPQSNVVMGIRKQDGSVTWISVNTRPLFRAGETSPYGVVFSFFDITERKNTEEVLRLSDEVLKQMPDSTVLTDLSGNICKWMGKSEHIFGYSASEVIGKPIHLLYRSDIRDAVFAKLLKAIQENGGFCGEIACLRKDGSELSVETTAKTFFDQVGQPLFIIFTNRDITERKRAEADIQRANEQLTIRINELEERHEEIILLSQMSNLLQSCINIEEASKVISQIVPLLFPNNSGALLAIANSRNLVEAIAFWGSPTSQMLFSTSDCIALRSCQPHLMEETSIGLTCKHLHTDSFPSSYFCIPLMAQGEAMGVLYLSYLEKGLLTKAKQHLAVAVARQISLAMANLKLHETLQQQSIRDPLTGLYNRRYLEESLMREVCRASRTQQSVGVIMLDVDHFKKFNDTFGHEAGDAVLRELGMFLHNNIRGGDIACRYGGEEFTLILPEASIEDTRRRAEQLRGDVKHLNIQYRRQSLGAITLSFGVACFPAHGETSEALIRAADAALYRAKAEGRDRVVIAT
ncbi:MAG: PAS domain S-box protein [Oscillatoriaceae bacterium SKW80]|nr:PAS domain S-box protein [Oscillatoriaceae bacterium SKYG93]MCX8119564.1 PAS domain S-box protein [Oscillatoriaceae bacterium SKW80]MDW8455031.1 PAS domain S-box protein [Oscillatoriaceae cyanobacterium SKYGB_i_bin93]HIK28192.1 PAS domain S-box protein [Oscillatoriaceae cyanobacterium M7585_C2015_266]